MIALRSPSSPRVVDIFNVAAITGAITGLLDVIAMVFFAFGRPEVAIPGTFWISVPLTWITFCVVVALVLSAAWLRHVAFAAVVFAATSVLLFSRVAPLVYAAFHMSLVSLGVASGVVAAVFSAICSYIVLRKASVAIIHRFSIAECATTAALAITCAGILVPKPLHSLGDRRLSPKPNIVLVFLDTLREDDRRSSMPALNRFSNDSVVFDNAWAPTPWTVPSHLAVLTGDDEGQAADHASTLADRLRVSGYSTWAIFANPTLGTEPSITQGYSHLSVSDSSGVSQSGIGFLLSRSHVYGGPRFPLFAWMSAPEVTSAFIEVANHAQRPYFITLNYMDAHSPYYVLPQCRDARFRSPTLEQVKVFRSGITGGIHLPGSTADAMRSEYRAAVRCMDRSLDLLLRAIEKQPDASRTVIVFVGDHGEQFGEHGYTQHGNSIYRAVLHVPLIVHIPGVVGTHIADPVNIADLHDALAAVVSSRASSPSMFPLLNAERRRPAVAEFAMGAEHAVGIADATYHAIHWGTGREEWFVYATDPAEAHPLAPPDTAEVAMLRDRLSRQSQHSVSKPFRALGYIQ